MMSGNLPFNDVLPCGVCRLSDVGELFSCRAKERVPQNAKSVIVYLFPYLLEDGFYKGSNVSKYAVPADYHLIVSKYLNEIADMLKDEYPDNQFSCFCDNSPVNEVAAAICCGLGVKGENGLLINEKYGSYCFIGEIVTDVECDCVSATNAQCLRCGLCAEKCPGKAIVDGRIDKNKCLSHITQMKGELSQEHIDLIKNSGCIWGCDICQDVCPMNKKALITPLEEFRATAEKSFSENTEIEGRAYAWRGRKVIERNFEYIK